MAWLWVSRCVRIDVWARSPPRWENTPEIRGPTLTKGDAGRGVQARATARGAVPLGSSERRRPPNCRWRGHTMESYGWVLSLAKAMTSDRQYPPVPAGVLLEPVSDATPLEVIRADLYLDTVPWQHADTVHPHLSRVVGQDFMAVVRLHTESCVFEGLGHGPLEQDRLLLCVGVRQCALPPAPGTQETQVAPSVPSMPVEDGARTRVSPHCSDLVASTTLVP